MVTDYILESYNWVNIYSRLTKNCQYHEQKDNIYITWSLLNIN